MPQPEPTETDAPHDVLAAEEFGVPGADPDLHHGPVVLPEDPAGDSEPHDVLAAEEFPMPAPRRGGAAALTQRPGGFPRLAAEFIAGLLLAVLLLRRRRRR
jgi:hypothetical protein